MRRVRRSTSSSRCCVGSVTCQGCRRGSGGSSIGRAEPSSTSTRTRRASTPTSAWDPSSSAFESSRSRSRTTSSSASWRCSKPGGRPARPAVSGTAGSRRPHLHDTRGGDRQLRPEPAAAVDDGPRSSVMRVRSTGAGGFEVGRTSRGFPRAAAPQPRTSLRLQRRPRRRGPPTGEASESPAQSAAIAVSNGAAVSQSGVHRRVATTAHPCADDARNRFPAHR